MRRVLLTLAAAAAASFFAGVVPAQRQILSTDPVQDVHDRRLAERIRQMADRSVVGLKQRRAPSGGVSVDLAGRFHDLAIVKFDAEGDPAVGCVSSVEGANRFFGRNLETGEVYPVSETDTQEYLRTKRSAPDMTMDEFLLYKEMIREAAPRLQGSGKVFGNGIGSLTNTSSTIINIVNNDGPNEGFNDPTPTTFEDGNNNTTLGAQRLALFKFAANIWAGVLDSTVPINIGASFDPMSPCSPSGGVLGERAVRRGSEISPVQNSRAPGIRRRLQTRSLALTKTLGSLI